MHAERFLKGERALAIIQAGFGVGAAATVKLRENHSDILGEPSQKFVVIPANAGIHFDFFSTKQDQRGFPLSRE